MQVSPNIPAFPSNPRLLAGLVQRRPNVGKLELGGGTPTSATCCSKPKRAGRICLSCSPTHPCGGCATTIIPSGSDSGGGDNLQSWNYNQHAIYLATVAKYASDHWGIQFNSVEPFNEPIANWWNANGTQEGCHFNTGTQATVISYLRSELDNRGLTNVNAAASDENTYDQGAHNLEQLLRLHTITSRARERAWL